METEVSQLRFQNNDLRKCVDDLKGNYNKLTETESIWQKNDLIVKVILLKK